MPEHFKERQQWEAEFVRRLQALNNHHQAIIREAMGTPPDPANVPEELWERLEADERRSNYWVILWVMLSAFRGTYDDWAQDKTLRKELKTITQKPSLRVDFRVPRVTGPIVSARPIPQGGLVLPPEDTGWRGLKIPRTPDMISIQARQIAATHAERLTARTIDTTRRKLADARRESAELDPGRKPDMDPVEVELERQFGKSRAETIAATEVTRAIGNGERIAAHEVATKFGWRLARIWQTERDEKVCPICGPLQGKPGPFIVLSTGFTDEIPGPPAHPNCRCWLVWKVLGRPSLTPVGPELVAT